LPGRGSFSWIRVPAATNRLIHHRSRYSSIDAAFPPLRRLDGEDRPYSIRQQHRSAE
jgi:hypothetical protein